MVLPGGVAENIKQTSITDTKKTKAHKNSLLSGLFEHFMKQESAPAKKELPKKRASKTDLSFNDTNPLSTMQFDKKSAEVLVKTENKNRKDIFNENDIPLMDTPFSKREFLHLDSNVYPRKNSENFKNSINFENSIKLNFGETEKGKGPVLDGKIYNKEVLTTGVKAKSFSKTEIPEKEIFDVDEKNIRITQENRIFFQNSFDEKENIKNREIKRKETEKNRDNLLDFDNLQKSVSEDIKKIDTIGVRNSPNVKATVRKDPYKVQNIDMEIFHNENIEKKTDSFSGKDLNLLKEHNPKTESSKNSKNSEVFETKISFEDSEKVLFSSKESTKKSVFYDENKNAIEPNFTEKEKVHLLDKKPQKNRALTNSYIQNKTDTKIKEKTAEIFDLKSQNGDNVTNPYLQTSRVEHQSAEKSDIKAAKNANEMQITLLQSDNTSFTDSKSSGSNTSDKEPKHNMPSNENRFENTEPKKFVINFKYQDVTINAVIKNQHLNLSLNANGTILMQNAGLEKEIQMILKESGFKNFTVSLREKNRKVYEQTIEYKTAKRDKSRIDVLA
ncbi:hypothetical protein [Nitrosophilus alvini]|uniref:hypothetical protein n=1 Tax=Nitrosophilus alvini TaxID=2714855 RepID=UPI00190B7363|nr:hypothetical protein [Nitrosophilus alvini]